MSQIPPYYQDDFDEPREEEHPYAEDRPAAPPRLSGMALASLICGVMFCLTPIPSLCAAIFGLIGLRETRGRNVSGRGFAVSGLVLGVVGTGLWLLLISAFYIGYNIYSTELRAADTVANAFVKDLADGKVDAALALCIKGTERGPLAVASEAMKKWGPFNSFDGELRPHQRRKFDGTFLWDCEGDAVFSRGECSIFLRLMKDGTSYRVDRFDWKAGG